MLRYSRPRLRLRLWRALTRDRDWDWDSGISLYETETETETRESRETLTRLRVSSVSVSNPSLIFTQSFVKEYFSSHRDRLYRYPHIESNASVVFFLGRSLQGIFRSPRINKFLPRKKALWAFNHKEGIESTRTTFKKMLRPESNRRLASW